MTDKFSPAPSIDPAEPDSADEVEKNANASEPSFGAKLFSNILFFFLWFFVGGFFSYIPLFAHNIERKLSSLTLYAPLVLWAAIPVTKLIVDFHPTTTAKRIYKGNLLGWVIFLSFLYIAWHFAYP